MEKRSRFRACLVLGVALTVSGCGGTPLRDPFKPIENIPQNKAVVYLYRYSGVVGFMYPIRITSNGKEVVKLRHGSYYPYLADPGEIEFSTKMAIMRTDSVTIEAKAGQVYYLAVATRTGIVGYATITKLSQQQAEPDLAQCNLVPEKDIAVVGQQ